MSRKRRMLCGLLALGLTALGLAGRRAWAAPIFTAEPDQGQTTVGVWVTDENINSMSVEVPLYVTLAVVTPDAGGTRVLAPAQEKYCLTNNSQNFDVAVTGLRVEYLTPGGQEQWKLTGGDPDNSPNLTKARDIALSLTLKEPTGQIHQDGSPVTRDRVQVLAEGAMALAEPGPFRMEDTGTTFKWRPIPKGGQSLALGWAGAAMASGDAIGSPVSATAQFRLVYTFSALQPDGTALGNAQFVTYEDIDVTEQPNP